ncbi:hypothetical protein A2210_00845 [Candidatus Woesebacteria bacterium RIFOXYA1_FULL_40_18]|uniref:Uncharacterized protein n=1 Tax=Candidatus Woesebacteria bacterium RIFOXYA1_FULL_40_18 TaxID=1802532 RepID=A0A1F8CL41_9BACT|nr:MAG: hypothetical protein A2210_00845 [Candidatus Woesebacteria bacterium RIFOXYA1_FULL_40_18]
MKFARKPKENPVVLVDLTGPEHTLGDYSNQTQALLGLARILAEKGIGPGKEFIDNLQIQEFVDRNTRLVEERGLMRQSPESSPKLILSRRFPGPSQERDKF